MVVGRWGGVVVVVVVVFLAGCGSHSAERTWTGSIDSHNDQVDFFEQPYDVSDVKVLCASTSSGLSVTITAPDGTQARAVQGNDGSQKSDIAISGGGHDEQTLTGGAIWHNISGATAFDLEPDGTYDRIFYLHDGAAVCPRT